MPYGFYRADLLALPHQGCFPASLVTRWSLVPFLDQGVCADDLAVF